MFPFFLNAQEVTADSFKIFKQDVLIDSVSTQIYVRQMLTNFDNFSANLDQVPMGDSASAVNNLASWQIQRVRDHAYIVGVAMQKPAILRQWNKVSAEMVANGFPALATVVQNYFENAFIGDVKVKVGTADFVQGTVTKNAQGILRLKYGTNDYRVTIFCDRMIRIVNYPTQGQSTDLYAVNNNNLFADMDRDIVIKFK
jgi:hypothetical protein